MTKSQAHNSVTEKYEAGLISLDEAQCYHQRIDEISTGRLNGSRVSFKQQSALYEIWA